MSTKIAVTDACIFIDLHKLNLTSHFFKLKLEIHTTSSVLFELYSEQKRVLDVYQSVNKLVVHNLGDEDYSLIRESNFPNSLSIADQTVLFIANALHAMVVSSDNVVRKHAKNKNIECHGMLWVFDQLIENNLLKPKEASEKLSMLMAINFMFRNDRKLNKEIAKRQKKWNSAK